MAIMKTNDPAEGMAAIGARAKDAAAQVVPLGKQAGTAAVQGVQTAKDWAAPRAADAVQTARDWATPRASDAVQTAREWAAPRAGRRATHDARAADAVQTAKEWAAPRAADAVRNAREWAAPRLDDAADAVTTTVAPKVSSALHSAARQVEPPASAKSGLRALLDWRLLLGIGAALPPPARPRPSPCARRYASATAAAENATAADAPEDGPADEVSAARRGQRPGRDARKLTTQPDFDTGTV